MNTTTTRLATFGAVLVAQPRQTWLTRRMAPTISVDEHAALLSDLTHAAVSLGWHVGITVAHCSVSAHRFGTDGAGGRVHAEVIGNGEGWHYYVVDVHGLPVKHGDVWSCTAAMRAALPFNQPELNS